MNRQLSRLRGMTLFEMLFVMVGIALLFVMLLNYTTKKAFDNRVARTVDQMQNILVAAQSYYVKNGAWPTSVIQLQTAGYLSANVQSSFGGDPFDIANSAGGQLFYVSTPINSATNAVNIARNISGRLPLSYLSSTAVIGVGVVPPNAPCAAAAPVCRVVAVINVPAQSLNDARRITYTGLVHHGGCIPVVPCPLPGNTWTPQIVVAPVSVSGVTKTSEPSSVYPISSFTAYATGGPGAGVNPPQCTGGTRIPCIPSAGTSVTDYWRVCVQVITTTGNVATMNTSSWGQYVTLLGITRCTNTSGTEPSGSSFSVYSR